MLEKCLTYMICIVKGNDENIASILNIIKDAYSNINYKIISIIVNIKKNDKEIISDIKFETLGCAAAIATSSMVTQMAKGKNLDAASEITRSDIAEGLEGLPPAKMHCSNLAADALKRAIEDYRIRDLKKNKTSTKTKKMGK